MGPGRGLDRYPATHGHDKLVDDGEPQARAELAAFDRPRLKETLEDPAQVLFGDAGPVVLHRHPGAGVGLAG